MSLRDKLPAVATTVDGDGYHHLLVRGRGASFCSGSLQLPNGLPEGLEFQSFFVPPLHPTTPSVAFVFPADCVGGVVAWNRLVECAAEEALGKGLKTLCRAFIDDNQMTDASEIVTGDPMALYTFLKALCECVGYAKVPE